MNILMSSRGDHRAANAVARVSAIVPTLLLAAALVSPATLAVADGHAADIVVVGFEGAVTIEKPDMRQTVVEGMVLVPPFTVHTGVDGTITIAQGDTEVTVKPNSELFVPAPKVPDSRVDTIRQERGNAMYDVEHRAESELRIETPFLVSVIKGTQFNIVVDDAQASVSLFEGQLEIRRGVEIGDLYPGEIAIARLGENGFEILKPDDPLQEQMDDLGASRPDDEIAADGGDDLLADDDISDDDISDDDISADDVSEDGDLGDDGLDDGDIDDGDFDDDFDDDLEDTNDDDSDDDSDDDGGNGPGRGKGNGGF